MMVSVFCEICREHIANADTDNLAVPMSGVMFKSSMADRGVALWSDRLAWEHMSCPYCRKRPFHHRDRIMITRHRDFYVFSEGYYQPQTEKTPQERNQDAINRLSYELYGDQGDAEPDLPDAEPDLPDVDDPLQTLEGALEAVRAQEGPWEFYCPLPDCRYRSGKFDNMKRHLMTKKHFGAVNHNKG